MKLNSKKAWIVLYSEGIILMAIVLSVAKFLHGINIDIWIVGTALFIPVLVWITDRLLFRTTKTFVSSIVALMGFFAMIHFQQKWGHLHMLAALTLAFLLFCILFIVLNNILFPQKNKE